MYIQEAVKEALKSGKWIRRKSFQEDFKADMRIMPTDTCECCIIAILNKSELLDYYSHNTDNDCNYRQDSRYSGVFG